MLVLHIIEDAMIKRGFTGERAVYSAANRLLSFTGKPKWRSGPNQGGAERLVLGRSRSQGRGR
jgi:hypothetical protein